MKASRSGLSSPVSARVTSPIPAVLYPTARMWSSGQPLLEKRMAWVWYWDAEPAVPCTKINGRTRSSGMSGMDGPGSSPLPELEPEPLRQPASSVAMPRPRMSPAPRRYAVLPMKMPSSCCDPAGVFHQVDSERWSTIVQTPGMYHHKRKMQNGLWPAGCNAESKKGWLGKKQQGGGNKGGNP